MVPKKRVAIIGSGVSGLAAAKAFKAQGHDVQGFERALHLGGVWEESRSYPGIQTQSPKDLYRYTDLPYPNDTPEWPTGKHVRNYLKSYAEKHGLMQHFVFGATVISMTQQPQGWKLVVKMQDGKEETHDFDFVAVCTGTFTDPKTPSWPHQDEFVKEGGIVLHSSEFNDPDLQTRGKHVVVIGGSKSATDVSVHAAQYGAKSVTMVYRRNMWRIPCFVAGKINFKHLLYMRAQEEQFDGYHKSSALGRVAKMLLKPFIWANFRALETLLTVQLGMHKWNMVPEERIEDVTSCELPVFTPGLLEAFEEGTIHPFLATPEKFSPQKLHLSSGKHIDCDVCILATGWNMNMPFLSDVDRSKLIGEDGQYRLYRRAVNPDLPNMGFVGLNSSFCTVLSSELVAAWLVRYADGQLASTPEDMHGKIEKELQWRRTERPAAQVYGGNCVAPFHFAHFDALLKDMGAPYMTGNLFKDYLSYPEADVYASFLAQAPKYDTG